MIRNWYNQIPHPALKTKAVFGDVPPDIYIYEGLDGGYQKSLIIKILALKAFISNR